MNPKDRGLIARMAGNIAGGLWGDIHPNAQQLLKDATLKVPAAAVDTAIAILQTVDARLEAERERANGVRCAGCKAWWEDHPNGTCRQWRPEE